MNRFEEAKFFETFSLIFKGFQLIQAGRVEEAIDHYDVVQSSYNHLTNSLKLKLRDYALLLHDRIIEGRDRLINGDYPDERDLNKLIFRDGTVVSSLLHLVFALETIDKITWEYHVNSSKNEVLDWIKYTLNERRLADILDGIDDQSMTRQIIFQHILMNMNQAKSFEESITNII